MAKNIGIVDKNNNLVDQAGLGVATPVVDNLTSDSTTSALSAKQGKLLNSNLVKSVTTDYLTLNNLTWTQSAKGMYYADFPVSLPAGSTIVGVTIGRWGAWASDYVIVPSVYNGLQLMSNKNTFDSSAKISLLVLYI